MPVYYLVFYFYITKFDVPTPGRGEGEVRMISKADYQAKGNVGTVDSGRDARVNRLLELLGGIQNLKSIDACITRLRIDVVHRGSVNDAALQKELGAAGVVGKGNNVQVIFGAEADIFKTELRQIKEKGTTSPSK
jgi:glucose-like phosphotransferase system IIB component